MITSHLFPDPSECVQLLTSFRHNGSISEFSSQNSNLFDDTYSRTFIIKFLKIACNPNGIAPRMDLILSESEIVKHWLSQAKRECTYPAIVTDELYYGGPAFSLQDPKTYWTSPNQFQRWWYENIQNDENYAEMKRIASRDGSNTEEGKRSRWCKAIIELTGTIHHPNALIASDLYHLSTGAQLTRNSMFFNQEVPLNEQGPYRSITSLDQEVDTTMEVASHSSHSDDSPSRESVQSVPSHAKGTEEQSSESKIIFENLTFNRNFDMNMTFPLKLFDMVSNKSLSHVIGWKEDGLSFQVLDIKLLCNVLLPSYFKHVKYSSFQRQLNLYRFRRINIAVEKGNYYHPDFRRGDRLLASKIRRDSTLALKESIQLMNCDMIGGLLMMPGPEHSAAHTLTKLGKSKRFDSATKKIAKDGKTSSLTPSVYKNVPKSEIKPFPMVLENRPQRYFPQMVDYTYDRELTKSKFPAIHLIELGETMALRMISPNMVHHEAPDLSEQYAPFQPVSYSMTYQVPLHPVQQPMQYPLFQHPMQYPVQDSVPPQELHSMQGPMQSPMLQHSVPQPPQNTKESPVPQSALHSVQDTTLPLHLVIHPLQDRLQPPQIQNLGSHLLQDPVNHSVPIIPQIVQDVTPAPTTVAYPPADVNSSELSTFNMDFLKNLLESPSILSASFARSTMVFKTGLKNVVQTYEDFSSANHPSLTLPPLLAADAPRSLIEICWKAHSALIPQTFTVHSIHPVPNDASRCNDSFYTKNPLVSVEPKNPAPNRSEPLPISDQEDSNNNKPENNETKKTEQTDKTEDKIINHNKIEPTLSLNEEKTPEPEPDLDAVSASGLRKNPLVMNPVSYDSMNQNETVQKTKIHQKRRRILV